MNTEKAKLIHGDLTQAVIDSFFSVYNELGSGFLENVYENALAVLLRERGLLVEQQRPLSVLYHGQVVGEYRPDLIVENVLIVEVKACVSLQQIHGAQLLNYLKATGMKIGLLVNFGTRPAFKRIIS